MTGFTADAHSKMMDLFNNHRHECGSQIASQHPDKTPTNCITYIVNVLTYAFEKKGDAAAVAKVKSLNEKGTELAAWLVNDKKWKGIYYNPDVAHPRDGESEHPFSWFKKVLPDRKYYGIPISHAVINYQPTDRKNGNFKSFGGFGGWKFETPQVLFQLDKLKKIKFAIGVSRGGRHTWMYSRGEIFEVHWDEIGADLYERSPFEDYEWLSGALAVPPDAIAAANFDQGMSYFDTARFLFRWIGDIAENAREDAAEAGR